MPHGNNNLSSLDLLKKIALSSHRMISASEEKISHRYGHTKRTAIIEDAQSETVMLWYSNPSNLSDFSMFWGMAFSHEVSKNCNLIIGKSNFWNRIPFIGPLKKNQTDSHYINSDFIIRGNGFEEIEKIIYKPLIHNSMLEIIEIDQRIRIYFNTINMDFCPQLKGKSTVSVIVRNHWELEQPKIEKIFVLTEKLRTLILS